MREAQRFSEQPPGSLKGWGLRKERWRELGQDKPSGGKAHRQDWGTSCSFARVLRGICPQQYKIRDVKTTKENTLILGRHAEAPEWVQFTFKWFRGKLCYIY